MILIILSMLAKDTMIYQSNDGSIIFKMFKNRVEFKKKKECEDALVSQSMFTGSVYRSQ